MSGRKTSVLQLMSSMDKKSVEIASCQKEAKLRPQTNTTHRQTGEGGNTGRRVTTGAVKVYDFFDPANFLMAGSVQDQNSV